MPTPAPTSLAVGTATPQDAVAAFEARGDLAPSFRWQDIWQDEHTRAFAVAGVQRLDVLNVLREALAPVVSQGQSLADFAKAVRPALQRAGYWGDVEVQDPATGQVRTTRFDEQRLRLIYDTNLRQSLAAGRWAAIERNKKRQPLVMYRTMRDERVRASHKPWNGVVLPVDHPWWNTHFPPCGWRCRCTAFALSQRDVDRYRADGWDVKTEPPPEQLVTYVNPATGEVVPVPRGIDPGFAYNPGKARDAALFDQLLHKALKASPLAGAVAVAQATQEFGQWVDTLLADRRLANGTIKFVGVIKPPAVRALSMRDAEPASAAIAVRDSDVLHALRDSKAGSGAGMPPEIYRRLPELLAQASALLLERGPKPALLYVVNLTRTDGRVAKLVLKLDETVRVSRTQGQVPLNVVRTATVIDPKALHDSTQYDLIWGSLE